MNVLSEVESDVEVGVNPTAARASASGINPVSIDTATVVFSLYRISTGLNLQQDVVALSWFSLPSYCNLTSSHCHSTLIV